MGVPIAKGRIRVDVGKGTRVAVDEGSGVVVGGTAIGIGVVTVPLHPTNSKRINPIQINRCSDL
jgi:hypothetical protein